MKLNMLELLVTIDALKGSLYLAENQTAQMIFSYTKKSREEVLKRLHDELSKIDLNIEVKP